MLNAGSIGLNENVYRGYDGIVDKVKDLFNVRLIHIARFKRAIDKLVDRCLYFYGILGLFKSVVCGNVDRAVKSDSLEE